MKVTDKEFKENFLITWRFIKKPEAISFVKMFMEGLSMGFIAAFGTELITASTNYFSGKAVAFAPLRFSVIFIGIALIIPLRLIFVVRSWRKR